MESWKGDEFFASYFTFNPEIVPNWSGHFILTFLNVFLPSYLAEKILLLFYFIGLPLAFRDFLKTLSPNGNAHLLSYFIFPFAYSFMLLMGFYNFSLAIMFFFITGTYYLKNQHQINTKRGFVLGLLLLATYFSHLVVFGLLLMMIAFVVLSQIIEEYFQSKHSIKWILLETWKKAFPLALASIIPLILAGFYFFTRTDTTEANYLEFRELVDWIKELRPLVMYNKEIEGAQTQKIFYLFGIMFVIAAFNRINKIQIDKKSELKQQLWSFLSQLINKHDVWIILAFMSMYLYFKLPDSLQGAGFISARLLYIFFIFLLIWLALQKFPKWFMWFNILCMLYLNFKLNNYYKVVGKDLVKYADHTYALSEHIEEETVILPIDRTGNWLLGHFSNYLVADKKAVILENYEASKDHFPIRWSLDKLPKMDLGTLTNNEVYCIYWPDNPNNDHKSIDYVYVQGQLNPADPCDQMIQNTLDRSFELVEKNDFASLYKIK